MKKKGSEMGEFVKKITLMICIIISFYKLPAIIADKISNKRVKKQKIKKAIEQKEIGKMA